MKRFLISLLSLVIVAAVFAANPRRLVIKEIKGGPITIGNKTAKIGEPFNSTDVINWTKDGQRITAQDAETRHIWKFSKEVFDSKGAIKTVQDYFLSITKGSTRSADGNLVIRRSNYKGNFPEKRIALVIGNSNYEYLSSLNNAQSDAVDIAKCLVNLGFDVIEAYETTYSDMENAFKRFKAMSGSCDVAMVYYAGHGVQSDGENYIIPIDNRLDSRSDLSQSWNCNKILDYLDDSNATVKMLYLDACRDTKTSWSRAATKGLASMEGSRGTVIMFSTQSGKTADDGDLDRSPFATAMLANLGVSRLSPAEMNSRITSETDRQTGSRQTPVVTGNVIGSFMFNPTDKNISVETPPAVIIPPGGNPGETHETPRKQTSKTGQPRIVMKIENIDMTYQGSSIKNDNLYLYFVVVNNNSKSYSGHINSCEDVSDDQGNVYPLEKIDFNVGGTGSRDLVLPPEGPVMLTIIIPDVPEDIEMIPYMRMYVGGRNFCEIRKVPVTK